MKLTTRTCNDCGYKFDLIEDKYFHKKLSKTKRVVEIVIKGEPTKCENCEKQLNRESKLKEIGI